MNENCKLAGKRNWLKGRLVAARNNLRSSDESILTSTEYLYIKRAIKDLDFMLRIWDPHFVRDTLPKLRRNHDKTESVSTGRKPQFNRGGNGIIQKHH